MSPEGKVLFTDGETEAQGAGRQYGSSHSSILLPTPDPPGRTLCISLTYILNWAWDGGTALRSCFQLSCLRRDSNVEVRARPCLSPPPAPALFPWTAGPEPGLGSAPEVTLLPGPDLPWASGNRGPRISNEVAQEWGTTFGFAEV